VHRKIIISHSEKEIRQYLESKLQVLKDFELNLGYERLNQLLRFKEI